MRAQTPEGKSANQSILGGAPVEGSSIRLLMVEDNPGITRVVRTMFSKIQGTSFEIDTAGTVSEGLSKLRQHEYDGVLLDLVLPDCQGINTVKILSHAFPDVAVVVLTGVDEVELGQSAIEAGAQDYLVKGLVDGELLSRTVRFAIQRHKSDWALKENQERLQNLVENLPDGVILYGAGGITYANPAALALLGADALDDVVGVPVTELCTSQKGPDLGQSLHGVLTGEYRFEGFREGECWKIGRKERVDCELLATPLYRSRNTQGQLILRDITNRKQADKYLRLATTVFESAAEGMVVWDAQGRIEMVNEAFVEITGYAAAEVLGREARFLDSGRHQPGFLEEVGRTLKEYGHWRGDFWARRKSGEVFVARLALSAIRDDQGRVTTIVGIFSDITEEKEQEAAIKHLANHDPLTGLPNRRLLHDRLSHALADRHREPPERNRLALYFVDLDDFKRVNDCFGHEKGDQALREMAHRILETLREGDTVARFGGDEFVILAKHLPSQKATEDLARKISAVIGEPLSLEGNGCSEGGPIKIAASIGIVMAPTHGDDTDTLLDRADHAMYRSKEAGKSCYHFF